MNILIADDDPVARLAISRLLQRSAPCSVTEVDNGLDAIEQIESQRFDLVLLDLEMPAMDGVEVLQVVRASPDHRDLPVVIVSSAKDEHNVAEVIKLGISDYVTKPLRSQRVAGRLARVLQAAAPAGDSSRRIHACLEPGKPLMIVDANGDFRHFFTSVMSARNPVREVPTGVQALKLCLETPPSALFVGPDIGALPPEALVRKLRENGRVGHTTLVGAWPKTMLESARDSGLFDEVIARTFVPEALLQQLNDVFARGSSEDVQATLKTLGPKTQSAVEQVFGMMLATELVADPRPLPAGPAIVSSIDITRAHGERLVFRIVVPVGQARQFAARLLLIDDATDADALSGIAEVASVIVSRLQKALGDGGAEASCGTPDAHLTDAPPTLDDGSPTKLIQCFASESGQLLFGVELGAEPAAAAA